MFYITINLSSTLVVIFLLPFFLLKITLLLKQRTLFVYINFISMCAINFQQTHQICCLLPKQTSPSPSQTDVTSYS